MPEATQTTEKKATSISKVTITIVYSFAARRVCFQTNGDFTMCTNTVHMMSCLLGVYLLKETERMVQLGYAVDQ